MDFDAEGNLYVCVYGLAGGSILRVDAQTRKVRLFARDLGVANYLVITRNKEQLWASDYRPNGRLLRFTLGAALPAKPDRIIEGLGTPNGLALGKDDQVLYAAETNSGNIVRASIAADPPSLSPLINLKGTFAAGSLDGLAFDPRDQERRYLYVAENLRGSFTVVDLRSQPIRVVKRFRLAMMGGRPCPASMVIRDGYLYFTDLWAANPFRIILGFPEYHTHAFRFAVKDLSTLYQ
jgi:sugar lactone lactonase YvrE